MSERWKLILHGNERYPFPLTIHTEDGSIWVTRDGTVSSLERAHLIAAAPALLEALEEAVEDLRTIAEIGPASVCIELQPYLAAIAAAKGEGK